MTLEDDLAVIRRVVERQQRLDDIAACHRCDAAGWSYDRRRKYPTKCKHEHHRGAKQK